MIEHERSYVFTHDSAHEFLQQHGMSLYFREDDPDPSIKVIEDCYLGQGMRVRRSWTQSEATPENCTSFLKGSAGKSEPPDDADVSYAFTRKTGEKSKGYRFEFEEEISEGIAKSLV